MMGNILNNPKKLIIAKLLEKYLSQIKNLEETPGGIRVAGHGYNGVLSLTEQV